MVFNVNENIYTSIKKDGYPQRVGVSNHYFDRNDERYWGVSLNEFESLLSNCITFNNKIDTLPDNISKDCIKGMNMEKYRYDEFCYKLVPSEDMIVIIGRTKWNPIRSGVFKPQPYWWNEYVVVSIKRCGGEGVLIYEKPIEEEVYVKTKWGRYKV